MGRKGFPESYDRRALLRFLADVKSGREEVFAPVYAHQSYDIVPGERAGRRPARHPHPRGAQRAAGRRRTDGTAPEVFLSDFFDFSIYVDAAEADIQRWYVERFLALRRTAFQDPPRTSTASPTLTDEQARETALGIWAAVNGPNLREQHRADPVAGPAGAAEGRRPLRPPGPASASSEPPVARTRPPWPPAPTASAADCAWQDLTTPLE